MEQKKYKPSFLPLFYDDLLNILNYIKYKLKNVDAAEALVGEIEKFESIKERKYPYYRIYVKNYIIFYVVIPNLNNSNYATMEVRRVLYHKQNLQNL